MDLRYRNAAPDDLPLIVEIYNSIVQGRMVTADLEPVTVESRMKWFDDHDPLHRPLWMVSANDRIVGWVSLQSFYGRPAYRFTAEISIYLGEAFRGMGYGTTILNHVMNNCASLEIKTLLGFIFAHNLPSMELFRRAGFEEWGVFPRVAVLDQMEKDLIIVGKRINP